MACASAAATRAPTLVFHLRDEAGATTSEFTRNSGGDPHCRGYTCRCPSLRTAREDKDGRPRRGACATSCTRTANLPAKAPSATTGDGVVSGPSGMMSTRRAAWMATPSSVPALRPSAVMPADRGREAALARRWYSAAPKPRARGRPGAWSAVPWCDLKCGGQRYSRLRRNARSV